MLPVPSIAGLVPAPNTARPSRPANGSRHRQVSLSKGITVRLSKTKMERSSVPFGSFVSLWRWNREAESCRELGRFKKDKKSGGRAVGTTTRTSAL